MNDRCDSSSQVGTNRDLDLVVLECHEPVLLRYRSLRGLRIADVGIDTVRIERGRDRTGGRQFVGEDVIVDFATDQSAISQGARLTPPASASLCGRLP